jgi:hypothetical protein
MHFLITLLVQMKDKSLLPCCKKKWLITTRQTNADFDFTQLQQQQKQKRQH